MLSNPSSSLQQRQRQHRRQNSTPSAFQAPKVPLLPATNIQRTAAHRRGQSLDQRCAQRAQPQQDDTMVSTNIGSQQRQQHGLREAQQQRLARPGAVPLAVQTEEVPPEFFEACFGPTGGAGTHTHLVNANRDTPQLSPTRGPGGLVRGGRQDITSFPGSGSAPPGGYLDGYGLGLDENGCLPRGHTLGGRVAGDMSQGSQRRWSRTAETHMQGQRPSTPPNQSVNGESARLAMEHMLTRRSSQLPPDARDHSFCPLLAHGAHAPNRLRQR